MKYQIKMSGGETYLVNEEEARELMLGEKKGLIGINSLKGVINLSFVISIIPENRVDRSKITEGRLHDGTKVVKRFGEWKDASNPELYLDYGYYPELAKEDGIMSEEEWENKSKLTKI